MTPLTKPVTRRAEATIREAGKSRRLVVTLYPGGTIGLRPERTRREETISLEAAWWQALKARLAIDQAAKKKRRR